MSSESAYWTIAEAAAQLRRGKLSPVELTQSALSRMEKLNPRLNAFITITAERALRDAKAAEREMRRGKYRGPLHGVPITLKDNIWTRGVRTTAGSKILKDFVPTADAEVAKRLWNAGAVLLGKTNLHEFAYGITTENPHYGATRNPWNTECIPGGSSGGSAAAVATGMGFGSVGTDTGGSIRIPSALCGIVGLKPTFGRVSCDGIVPLAATLDHAGPIARTVADIAILLDAIAANEMPDGNFHQALRAGAGAKKRRAKLRLGWPREYFFERVDEEVKRAVEKAAREFEKMGARIERCRCRISRIRPSRAHRLRWPRHWSITRARDISRRARPITARTCASGCRWAAPSAPWITCKRSNRASGFAQIFARRSNAWMRS